MSQPPKSGRQRWQKMEKNKNDNFKEIQSYMKRKGLHNTRMAFKVRCEMLPDIKGNF